VNEKHIYTLDDWSRLRRFLILGSEAAKYSASRQDTPALTADNAQVVQRLIKEDGRRVVNEIIAVSDEGLAPKNDPALFALALAASFGDDETRSYALQSLPKVARIGTHVLHFAEYVTSQRGWGQGLKKAVARWFNDMPAEKLAYQAVKYNQRDGWSMRDLLRLSHAAPVSPMHDVIYQWLVGKNKTDLTTYGADQNYNMVALNYLHGYDLLRTDGDLSGKHVARIVQEYNLPREAVPTQYLDKVEVWEALLPNMPIQALVRNLATLTRLGVLHPMSSELRYVRQVLSDQERLRKSRIHPLAVLSALATYSQGHGFRGTQTWNPLSVLTDALDAAFYTTFKNVEPSGKRHLLALDVSGSMEGAVVAGMQALSARQVTAAMALVTMAVEPETHVIAFSGGDFSYRSYSHRNTLNSNLVVNGIQSLDISPTMRLDDVMRKMQGLYFSNTDCSLPMLWAERAHLDVDTFVVYTDNETNSGAPPATTLRSYRQNRNAQARLAVVGTSSTDFTIAEPDDPGTLDVVGFSADAPAILAEFARGNL
jgi:60 kDa SS-A/Ro ribonucleoprotein